jgi:hypothetical protein
MRVPRMHAFPWQTAVLIVCAPATPPRLDFTSRRSAYPDKTGEPEKREFAAALCQGTALAVLFFPPARNGSDENWVDRAGVPRLFMALDSLSPGDSPTPGSKSIVSNATACGLTMRI